MVQGIGESTKTDVGENVRSGVIYIVDLENDYLILKYCMVK